LYDDELDKATVAIKGNMLYFDSYSKTYEWQDFERTYEYRKNGEELETKLIYAYTKKLIGTSKKWYVEFENWKVNENIIWEICAEETKSLQWDLENATDEVWESFYQEEIEKEKQRTQERIERLYKSYQRNTETFKENDKIKSFIFNT
jgi:hypothetical protein